MTDGEKLFEQMMAQAKKDASEIALAFFQCDDETKTQVAGMLLDGLERRISARKARKKDCRTQQKTLDTLLRAMDRQDVDPPTEWEERMASLLAADLALAEKQRNSAAFARAEGEDRREFEKAWQKHRAARPNKVNGSTASQPPSSDEGQED